MYTQRWVRDGNLQQTFHQYGSSDNTTERSHSSLLPVDVYLQKYVATGPLPQWWYFFKAKKGKHKAVNGSVPIFQSRKEARAYQQTINQRVDLCEKTLKSLLMCDLAVIYIFDFDPHFKNDQHYRLMALWDIKRYKI